MADKMIKVTLTKSPIGAIPKHKATVEEDSTITLNVVSKAPANASVTWSSDNTSEATVANGVVTGEAPGTVVITATITDGTTTATDSCTVTVTEKE